MRLREPRSPLARALTIAGQAAGCLVLAGLVGSAIAGLGADGPAWTPWVLAGAGGVAFLLAAAGLIRDRRRAEPRLPKLREAMARVARTGEPDTWGGPVLAQRSRVARTRAYRAAPDSGAGADAPTATRHGRRAATDRAPGGGADPVAGRLDCRGRASAPAGVRQARRGRHSFAISSLASFMTASREWRSRRSSSGSPPAPRCAAQASISASSFRR